MTSSDTESIQSRWQSLLATAAGEVRGAAGPAALVAVAAALRLGWAAAGAVEAGDPDGQIWWLRLSEGIAETTEELDLIPAASPARLGTGPRPPAALTDDPQLRKALLDLLAAVHTALAGYARHTRSGPAKLAATLAAAAARAAAGSG